MILAKDMPDTEKRELVQYWHTARIAGFDSCFDRLQYAVSKFVKAHPEYNRTGVYKVLESETRGYGWF